jgi:hypothetical protein
MFCTGQDAFTRFDTPFFFLDARAYEINIRPVLILDPWSFQTGIFGKCVSLIPFSLVC